MSVYLVVTITCETCQRSLAIEAEGAGTNASSVRRLAADDYGWVVAKGKEQCFDHRGAPLDFHDVVDDGRSNLAGHDWLNCAVCGEHDSVSKPSRPRHRGWLIKTNADKLRERGQIVYR